MTYLQFHFVFIIPVILLLGIWAIRDLRRGIQLSGGFGNRFASWAVLAHILVALIYTTPWDNYLVYRQVWNYPDDRVLFTIGYVPIEEYLFFVLQPILTSLWLFALARRFTTPLKQNATSLLLEPGNDAEAAHRHSRTAPYSWPQLEPKLLIRLVGLVVAVFLAGTGVICLTFDRGTYLGLILVWAGPVLALQWAYGGDWIAARWRLVVLGIAAPTLYLWLADHLAIGLNIWWINPNLTTGLKFFGLPVEEALFFLITNVFIVFGLVLTLHEDALTRIRFIKEQLRSWQWWKGTLVLWALSMISVPLLPEAFPIFAYISTSLLSLGILGYALSRYGRRAWLLFAVSFAFGLAVEWFGQAAGFPFGNYRYTAPGPELAGVPLLVPLGWWAFSFIAIMVVKQGKVFLAPLAMLAWDLGLDPLMVNEGFWQFERGFYYGVPMSNFIGWYGTGFVLVWLLLKLEPRLIGEHSPAMQVVYAAQAFLISLGLVFFGMPVAGFITFIAMASFIVPSFVRQHSLQLRRTG